MEKYSKYLWALVTLIFITFIGVMSYWYPVTLDEYFRWGDTYDWELIADSFSKVIPRVSVFLSIPVFILGRWFFIILNPLIQLGNCLCIFYILFVRLPNIKSLKDMPYFITILLMSIFFVCVPSQVIFWVSGAINYTWSILFLLLMLCFVRKIQTEKIVFKDNLFFKICLFVLGFIVGMSNECIVPIALVATVGYALFCEYKKIKTPRTLSFLIFGLAIGCLVFFSAPVHYNKMSIGGLSNISAVSFSKKIFFHISHLNEFFSAQLYLFFGVVIFLILAFVDNNHKKDKKEDLWTSLFMLFISFTMALILFVVPQPPARAFYPASVFCLIAFLFLVKYYIKIYNFDFSKWLCYIILAICLFLSPRFILPHYSLHIQDNIHKYLESQPEPIIIPYIVLKGTTNNLSIGLMDPARMRDLGNNMYGTDASPLINW
jgi:hypothetical protein